MLGRLVNLVIKTESARSSSNKWTKTLYQDFCWRALVRQLPILYNSEKKAKSVGCKIEDMRSPAIVFFLYPGIPGCL